MKTIFTLLLSAMLAMTASAQNIKISALPSGGAVSSGDLYITNQGGSTYSVTAAQLKTFIVGSGFQTPLTFTAPLVNASGTVTVMMGSSGGAEAWSTKLDAFAALSAPGANGYVLSGTTSGSLAWVPPVIVTTASGTNVYTATPSPALTSYSAGLYLVVTFTNGNTGGASLNLNSLGSVPIQQSGATLNPGQIPSGARVALMYDGSDFQIIGNSPGTYAFSTGLTLSGGAVTVNPSQNISTLSNLTTDGLVTTSGGTGALSVTTLGPGVLDALGETTGGANGFAVYDGSGNLTLPSGLTIPGLFSSDGGAFTSDGSGHVTVASITGNGAGLTGLPSVHVLSGTLSAGSATVTVPSAVAVWVQNTNTSTTNVGALIAHVSGTTATVTSTNGADTSPFKLFYWQ